MSISFEFVQAPIALSDLRLIGGGAATNLNRADNLISSISGSLCIPCTNTFL